MIHRYRKLLLTLFLLALGGVALSQLRSVSLAQLWGYLQSLSLTWLLVDFACSLCQVQLWIWRLWFARPTPPHPSYRGVVQAVVFGQFLNNFLPARGGEAVKVFILSRSTPPTGENFRGNMASGAGLFVADKISDVLTLFIIVGVGAGPALFAWVKSSSHRFFTLLLILAVVALLIWAIAQIPKVQLRLRAVLAGMKQGLSGVRNGKQFSLSLLSAFTCWGSEIFALWAIAHASGVELTTAQTILLLFAINVAMSLPISVANVGAFEATFAYTLTQFNVPLNQGLAIATAHHVVQLASVTLWASAVWFFLWRKDRRSLSQSSIERPGSNNNLP